ncbi:hypothetical protein [Pseudoflavonifractor phocaeensis]|uniref:hypothetical protein n=1 Tax=Pseudoflavonifractor phocaeensis TaxID=1870988 RepID=UPI00210A7AD9|nr:hypothetical protein [Pseudoflavonifractor phocaeensis]MCQ4865266.1 hypothetical protein [Pseudoflavonifractor phocaeensis]
MADRRYQIDRRDIRYDASGLDGTPRRKNSSWVPIIVFMLLFWPVGIVLLILKLKNDRSGTMQNGKVVFGIGVFLAVMGVMYLIMFFSGSLTTSGGRPYPLNSFLSLLLFFILGGAALIVVGTRMKKTGLKYRRYINLVVNNRLSSIDKIASGMGCSYDQAVVDLQKMQDDGYFPHALIDFSKGLFYLDGIPRDMGGTADAPHPASPRPGEGVEAPPAVKVVTCRSCGAQNTVAAGTVCECEYCGSPISS